jgi:hypothetical protein
MEGKRDSGKGTSREWILEGGINPDDKKRVTYTKGLMIGKTRAINAAVADDLIERGYAVEVPEMNIDGLHHCISIRTPGEDDA